MIEKLSNCLSLSYQTLGCLEVKEFPDRKIGSMPPYEDLKEVTSTKRVLEQIEILEGMIKELRGY